MPDTTKPACPPHPSYDASGFCTSCGFNGRTGAAPVVETSQVVEAVALLRMVINSSALTYQDDRRTLLRAVDTLFAASALEQPCLVCRGAGIIHPVTQELCVRCGGSGTEPGSVATVGRAFAKAEQAPPKSYAPNGYYAECERIGDLLNAHEFVPGEGDDPSLGAAIEELLLSHRQAIIALHPREEQASGQPSDAELVAAAREVINYMLDRGAVAPSSELRALVEEILARRLGVKQ